MILSDYLTRNFFSLSTHFLSSEFLGSVLTCFFSFLKPHNFSFANETRGSDGLHFHSLLLKHFDNFHHFPSFPCSITLVLTNCCSLGFMHFRNNGKQEYSSLTSYSKKLLRKVSAILGSNMSLSTLLNESSYILLFRHEVFHPEFFNSMQI